MKRATILVVFAILQFLATVAEAGEGLEKLYSAKAIVTGTGEKNRQPGFRDCLGNVILRVSGDQRLLKRSEMRNLLSSAGSFVRSFSYRDRLAGKPVHDEQGTYDRPHDLTCYYDRDVVDRLLAMLGSRPWLALRPRMLVLLDVERYGKSYRVTQDNDRDEDMRVAFENAARPLAMQIAFPTAENDPLSSNESVLRGSLTWSDADLGWVAKWQLYSNKKAAPWEARGVNYDEAFRVAMRGAAQILSGNGQP